MKKKDYKQSENFINRELSWLEFNQRVLEEAQDNNNPILERLKFAAIVSSNLDEFFMVRVASLKDQVHAGFEKADSAGLTPISQLEAISERTHKMVEEQYNCYNRSLVPLLRKENISIIKVKNLNEKQRLFVRGFYKNNIYPVLTPMVVDHSRPFPLLLNKSLNVALLLQNRGDEQKSIFATVQVPTVLDRLVHIPTDKEQKAYVLLEEVIKMNMSSLFEGHEILDMGCYRITRNADQGLDEEGAEDLLEAIEQFVKKRKWGAVIRIEAETMMSDRLLEVLTDEMEVSSNGMYRIAGPVDLTFLMKMSSQIGSISGFEHLRFPNFEPSMPEELIENDIFEQISSKDIILHHPFQSFSPVVDLVKKASEDTKVLAIKQTLYRVSGNSPIIEALAQAAENGKQVTVLLELKARFDEENNINWAKKLERAGCHVIYGLVGLKTHCKLLLIVRAEDSGIKRYVHLGTGNYNDVTARIYTDIGLMTSNPYFGADASALFNMLSGYSKLTRMYKMDVAPVGMRERFLSLIRQEADNAKQGKKAKICAKLNSLVDERIIEALYEASNAGVQIELVVRGICCLKPGIPGVSENIRVISIVGRFLEHSRIYIFENDGDTQVFLSSADWMGRNLDRRVEVLFPIEEKYIKNEVISIFEACLTDTVKARVLNRDGKYGRIDRRGKEVINSQQNFLE